MFIEHRKFTNKEVYIMTTSIFISELNSNNIVLKLSTTHKSIFKIFEKYVSDLNNLNENDIDNLMEYFNENSKRLNNLLTKNKRLSDEIITKLDLFSFYGKSFSKSQIKMYKDYLSLREKEKNSIKASLSIVTDRNITKKLSSSILDNNADYKSIAEQIAFILFEQNKAIKKLQKITAKASKFLKSF